MLNANENNIAKLVTVTRAAKIIGVSIPTFYRRQKSSKKFPQTFYDDLNRPHIKMSDIEKYIRSLEVRGNR